MATSTRACTIIYESWGNGSADRNNGCVFIPRDAHAEGDDGCKSAGGGDDGASRDARNSSGGGRAPEEVFSCCLNSVIA